MPVELARRALAELIGTMLLVAAVVGSGIAATRLSDDVGVQLLINAVAQVVGACLGAVLANLMYGLSAVSLSDLDRSGGGLLLAEVVATAGLLLVVFGVVRSGRASVAPFAVAAYIASAYFTTSSTSFANPAVTVGRTLSDTFAGISPGAAPAFVAMQAVGAAVGLGLIRLLHPGVPADDVLVPHPTIQES